nr:hypothetical protein Iba_chr06bCG11950 [Ipomoea batatas]
MGNIPHAYKDDLQIGAPDPPDFPDLPTSVRGDLSSESPTVEPAADLLMYPYLDFFNDPEPREMDFMNDPVLDDQDLRSQLNARVGSDRAHPEEPPPEDPVNIIHEAPTLPPGAGLMPYQYPVHPMGILDLNYQWWQHTP